MKTSIYNKTNIILFYSIIFFSFYMMLGLVPLFDLDEGAFSEATREMLNNHNYITTYLNGELRFDKPILIYWLQLFSVKVFGLNEFALRLPSAIAGTLWAYSIFYFTKLNFQKETAFLTTILFVSTLQISIIVKAAIADSLLNLFIASSMLIFYTYYKTEKKLYLHLTFLLIGLGTLTKGPVAIMIPIVVSFIFYLLKGKIKSWARLIFNPIGILLFLVVALPWYLLEYLQQGQLFIDGFILKHNLNRFNDSFEGHSGSHFYYIGVLLIGLLPNTGIFIRSLTFIKDIFKDDLKLYLFIWFIFVLVFFSFSGTKLPHYVIYGYTPLFIFMGIFLTNINFKRKIAEFFTLYFPNIFFLTLLLLLPIVLKFIKIGDKFVASFQSEIISSFGITYYFLMSSAIVLVIFLSYYKKGDTYIKLFLSLVVFVFAINILFIPKVANVQQQAIKDIAKIAKEKNLDVVMYRMNNPSFNVYSEKIVRRNFKDGDYIMLKKIYLKDIKSDYKILFEKMGIILVKLIPKKS